MSKKTFLNLFKWLFAALILFLLFKSGKLSMNDIKSFVSKPYFFIACLACNIGIFLVVFARWRLILKSIGIHLDYFSVLRLGMLGQFFSAVIPGSVGGDLVKALYIARRYPAQKTRALSTVLLDRVVGLCALIILGGLAFLVGQFQLDQVSPESALLIRSFGWALLVGAVAVVVGLLLFSFAGKSLPQELPAFFKKLPLEKTFRSLYQLLLDYRQGVSAIWKGVGVSFFVHAGNVAILYLAATSIFGPAPWGSIHFSLFILAAVLGMCSLAIPVAPLGLGVGQVAFAAIFHAVGAPNANFGTAIVTAMQIINLIMNLSGAVFFATYRHEIAAERPVEALS